MLTRRNALKSSVALAISPLLTRLGLFKSKDQGEPVKPPAVEQLTHGTHGLMTVPAGSDIRARRFVFVDQNGKLTHSATGTCIGWCENVGLGAATIRVSFDSRENSPTSL